MKIAVVSRSWPSNERSGVTLVAASHVRILSELGHEISIIGAYHQVLNEQLPVVARFHVPARGAGSIYAPAHVDRSLLESVLKRSSAEIVIIESWQTALTDAAVDISFKLSLPVLMVSHGVSVHSFTNSLVDIIRSLGWLHYRLCVFPRLVSRLSALTTLDHSAKSKRFFDRIVANKLDTPVVLLVNSPVHWDDGLSGYISRKRQILVIGYYSAVKNQIGALLVMAGLPQYLQFKFIGPRSGDYFERCRRRSDILGLGPRVTFVEDHECSLAEEIGNSLVVLSTSTTEALPISLLEAMASGTPFVATPVGAVPSLKGGIIARGVEEQRSAIVDLVTDETLWNQKSKEGRNHYKSTFTSERVRENLLQAVDVALNAGSIKYKKLPTS